MILGFLKVQLGLFIKDNFLWKFSDVNETET